MRFLNTFIVAACSMFMLAGCNSAKQSECCCCPADKEMNIQLYSARDLIGNAEKYAENHEAVLKALAEMGYSGVEAANYGDGKFYGVSPEQFKADVEAAGLKVVSSHTGHGLSDEELATGNISGALAWWDEALPAHKAAGMEYVVIPSIRKPDTLKELQVICNYFNEIGKRCQALGMKFGYHNHAYEMEKIEDKIMIEYMLENTDPALVFYQIDVYWAVYGHYSPADLFNKYPGRFALLHIKDKKEIGQSGMVGFDAVFGNAEVAGLEGYVVEVEGCRNEAALDGIRVSADYLRKAPFVKASYGK
jgi:sugar phosphate isomerase/epimerase